MMRSVTVSAPSRLHFGLLRFKQAEGPSFGGLGMMIAAPRVEAVLTPAERWSAAGPHADRAVSFARRAWDAVGNRSTPRALHVQINEHIPSHRGLGGGTQLALAVAAGVRWLCGEPIGTAEELASAVGRGRRSAVGSHGFVHGGLIWETGHRASERLSPLKTRIALPPSWRIVLIAPSGGQGLSGAPERDVFDKIPPVSEPTVARLTALAEREILPAAEDGDIERFGEGVYEYGRLSGKSFAPVQGGPYASADIAECVTAVRRMGVHGVGQSSWGPTVFAIVGGEEQARQVVEQLGAEAPWSDYELLVTEPDNRGAVLAT